MNSRSVLPKPTPREILFSSLRLLFAGIATFSPEVHASVGATPHAAFPPGIARVYKYYLDGNTVAIAYPKGSSPVLSAQYEVWPNEPVYRQVYTFESFAKQQNWVPYYIGYVLNLSTSSDRSSVHAVISIPIEGRSTYAGVNNIYDIKDKFLQFFEMQNLDICKGPVELGGGLYKQVWQVQHSFDTRKPDFRQNFRLFLEKCIPTPYLEKRAITYINNGQLKKTGADNYLYKSANLVDGTIVIEEPSIGLSGVDGTTATNKFWIPVEVESDIIIKDALDKFGYPYYSSSFRILGTRYIEQAGQ